MNKISLQKPLHVLIVKRNSSEPYLQEIFHSCIDLLLSKSCEVYTENSEKSNPLTTKINGRLLCKINLLVTLGGDGTVIWATSLFVDGRVPPVVSFNLGSLGFMAKFPPTNITENLEKIILSDSLNIEYHSRLKYLIKDRDETFSGFCSNEISIDRGAIGNLIELEIYLGGEFCTTAVGDGILVATPCGSTAYSLSAGGSIVHYGIQGILITPICPHSLSFRPLIVPDSVSITIKIPKSSRISGWVNIDGKTKIKVELGAVIEIRLFEFGVPCNW